MKFAPVDRNASAAIKASVVFSLKRFAQARAAVSPRDLFRPIRVQGRKITSLFIEHMLWDLVALGAASKEGDRYLPTKDPRFYDAVIAEEGVLGLLSARAMRRYYGQAVPDMPDALLEAAKSMARGPAPPPPPEPPAPEPVPEPVASPEKDEPEPEPATVPAPESDDPEPGSSSVPRWQEGLTPEQIRILMAAQEAILVLADGEPHARREIFAGADKEPWQDLFYKRLERDGVIVKSGERFQTRWTCVPQRMADISTLEDLIPFVLSDAEMVAYKATLMARSRGESEPTIPPPAEEAEPVRREPEDAVELDEIAILRMAVEKQKQILDSVIDTMLDVSRANADLRERVSSLEKTVQLLEARTGGPT